ncbi:MAG TPA: hypothetical protein PKJ32_03655 [Piscinibacter sp.]|nr:hypothetical protein [Piscinibacter sp.]HNW62070.1 hypothetical protein [Piscinibacter sp.]HOY35848.1 hypothetical protein [Piscinibacter sp.]
MRKQLSIGALAALMSLACAAQTAVPMRKPGLWETRTDARQGATMRHCVGAGSDDLMQAQPGATGRGQCTAARVTREAADRVVVESSCQSQGRTTITRAVFTGNFETNVKADFSMRMDPPRKGRSEGSFSMEMRWQGACPAGMQPGQIQLPNGMVIDPRQGMPR